MEPLCRGELLDLAERVAADADRWRHLVRHAPDRRVYEELVPHASEHGRVGLWLICWMDDQDTGFHDHDVSSGAVAVVAGRIRDERLAIDGGPRSRVYGPRERFDFGPSDIHRMAHAGGGPAVSIHVYSPPLQRMGTYAIAPDGVLRRTPVSYTEELRPVEPAGA